jgi:hypothetical protein
MIVRAGVAILLLATGCGSGDSEESGPGGFAPGTTCGLDMTVSGAIEDSIAPKSSIACATQLSSSAGFEAGFLAVDNAGSVSTVNLGVDTVEKGKTGTGFSAELEIVHADKRRWKTSSCTVDVIEHALDHSDSFADHYRTVGTGACSAPATSVSGSDPDITVESLAFVATVPWTK